MSPVAPVVPEEPAITVHLVVSALAFVVAQAVALGAFGASTGRTILQVGGIVLPALYAVLQSLHITLVHTAKIKTGVR